MSTPSVQDATLRSCATASSTSWSSVASSVSSHVNDSDFSSLPGPKSSDSSLFSISTTESSSLARATCTAQTKQRTLVALRDNALKSNNQSVQFEFAMYLLNNADGPATVLSTNSSPPTTSPPRKKEFNQIKEAMALLSKLTNRGHAESQYYLGDCYFNGIGQKLNNPDHGRAFSLFMLAAKQNHADALYRIALAYEYGWGCGVNVHKAVHYHRKAASIQHPGAMLRLGMACIRSEISLSHAQREGVKWLKRAAEVANDHYNSAPYELALLHEKGYKDMVFADEAYAAQLFALSADLGHSESAFRLGQAYENGQLGCPKEPSYSLHYYTLASEKQHSQAMMCLSAWFLVGIPDVLEPDREEAFLWASKSCELGMLHSFTRNGRLTGQGNASAMFLMGFFYEMGIGTSQDQLEANKYYTQAAEYGDERAKKRLIQATQKERDTQRHKGHLRGKRNGKENAEDHSSGCVMS